jgi:hypothetical protein
MEQEKKLDVEKLDVEKLEQISDQIGESIKVIIDKSIEDVNEILKQYGMKAKMQVVIEEDKQA